MQTAVTASGNTSIDLIIRVTCDKPILVKRGEARMPKVIPIGESSKGPVWCSRVAKGAFWVQ